jgi:hypothetical protein
MSDDLVPLSIVISALRERTPAEEAAEKLIRDLGEPIVVDDLGLPWVTEATVRRVRRAKADAEAADERQRREIAEQTDEMHRRRLAQVAPGLCVEGVPDGVSAAELMMAHGEKDSKPRSVYEDLLSRELNRDDSVTFGSFAPSGPDR